MRGFGLPRRTLALIGANSLCAAVQGQFQFVLPWMLLSRGYSAQVAALATGLVYAPLLLTAIPAGAAADSADPRRLMRISTYATLVACALYPVAALAGHDQFVLVLVAAVVVGATRNFSEGALFRGIGDTTRRGGGLLRAHAVRTTVNQAAVFGSPFVGLLLFRFGGAIAVLVGICVVLLGAVVLLGFVPELERESEPLSVMRANAARGVTSLRLNRRLRTIGWANLSWCVFAGAAIGIMPAVLRQHLEMGEVTASATFLAGAVVVVLLTIPVVRMAQSRVGPVRTFLVAITVQAAALVLFADSRAAIIGPLVYCVFLLSNSAAAASLNGARAAEVDYDHQGLLNMALLTLGMIGFITGIGLAAGLLGLLGYGLLLVLIAAGMASTAFAFRRPLVVA